MDLIKLTRPALRYCFKHIFFASIHIFTYLSHPSPIIACPFQSLTESQTPVLIDVTLAVGDANVKLVAIVAVAHVDAEQCCVATRAPSRLRISEFTQNF